MPLRTPRSICFLIAGAAALEAYLCVFLGVPVVGAYCAVTAAVCAGLGCVP